MKRGARGCTLIVGVLAASFTLSMGVSVRGQPSSTEPEGFDWDDLECTAINERLNFTSYWVGPSFDGLELTTVIRSCDAPPRGEPAGWDSVDFSYGECDASRGGCAPPISIQTWPYELRNEELIDIPGTPTTVEGVPATNYGGRLEIYHGDSTVVIHTEDPARGEGFAKALIEAPKVLSDLSAVGIVFESDCVNDIHYCQGDRLGERQSWTEWIVIALLLFLVGPFLAFLFRPSRLPPAQAFSEE